MTSLVMNQDPFHPQVPTRSHHPFIKELNKFLITGTGTIFVAEPAPLHPLTEELKKFNFVAAFEMTSFVMKQDPCLPKCLSDRINPLVKS
jgi:hypothetical protein